MTDTKCTTATPEDATPDLDFEEPEEAVLRRELGLRPIYYVEDDGNRGSHPDKRPCPPWCWVGQQDEYDHELNQASPLVATHTLGQRIAIVSQPYVGHFVGGHSENSPRALQTATLEFALEQRGTGHPQIKLARRAWDRDRTQRYDNLLKLPISDAKEVVTVLSYLIDLVEKV